MNRILGIFVLRPWSWVVDFTFAGEICAAFGFDFVYPSFPEHITRPLPWFESIHFFPSFDKDDSKAKWIEFHDRIKRDLETSLPQTRFLAFDVKTGWDPLLAFLGVDDPSLSAEPFPNVNDKDSLLMVRRVMDVLAAGLPLWLTLIAGGLICCFATIGASVPRLFGDDTGTKPKAA